jgi:hypothetical protein
VDRRWRNIESVEGHPWVRWIVNAKGPHENAPTWRISVANQYAANNLGKGAAALFHMSEGGGQAGQNSDTYFTAGAIKSSAAVVLRGRNQGKTTILFFRGYAAPPQKSI